ncbi:CRISPR-associated endonuclease Cas1 2 [Candidatus Hydrogenisulfobacillus filiaventi]|uniref:CRISPR-associated endonuclease Cas1 n=1 Tax=Candidatus Hydrogenisulfobacillus filiaventi TaxID=2707344 RepID=A0A6F8ZD48_9FIRM|nr:CRISPR-associated endonuclease Cas1 2 [Candidatus Hydrogenisulfobacillus filiaventi]
MERTIHIFSSGVLRRHGDTIAFEGKDGTRYLPVEAVAEIMVHGEVDLNKRFLEFLSEKEIPLHYFNHFGNYMGTFYPHEHYNSGFMILKQAEYYLDPEKRLQLARRFVSGASRNLLRVLRYYRSRGKDLDARIGSMEDLTAKLETCATIPELMAIEGNLREMYYNAFDTILDHPAWTFDRRSRRPPENSLNSLISFGNSLLYATSLSEIYKTHLDPRIGYLHTTNWRRFSLNLDISEIFKPVLVDRLIFTMVGKGMIRPSDFHRESGGLFLTEAARRRFVEEYENRLRTVIRHRRNGRLVSYRRLIRLDLYRLEKHLIGEEPYDPFVAAW